MVILLIKIFLDIIFRNHFDKGQYNYIKRD